MHQLFKNILLVILNSIDSLPEKDNYTMNDKEIQKIRHSGTCSLCGHKVKLLDRNYTHILSDGTLCHNCNMTILQLLSARNSWIDKDEYLSVMDRSYNWREEYIMPLEKAQALFELRDIVCNRFLKTIELDNGDVFVAQEVFQMPKSPAIFILRALKVKNKAVIQGFALKGKFKKGDSIKLRIGSNIQTVKALDVVPCGTNPLIKSTFFDNLSTNVHNHTIDEGQEGWIIIDTEEFDKIKPNDFVAKI